MINLDNIYPVCPKCNSDIYIEKDLSNSYRIKCTNCTYKSYSYIEKEKTLEEWNSLCLSEITNQVGIKLVISAMITVFLLMWFVINNFNSSIGILLIPIVTVVFMLLGFNSDKLAKLKINYKMKQTYNNEKDRLLNNMEKILDEEAIFDLTNWLYKSNLSKISEIVSVNNMIEEYFYLKSKRTFNPTDEYTKQLELAKKSNKLLEYLHEVKESKKDILILEKL